MADHRSCKSQYTLHFNRLDASWPSTPFFVGCVPSH